MSVIRVGWYEDNANSDTDHWYNNADAWYLRYGCPKKMAEQKFYETIAAIKKEREARAAEEKKLEEKFDPK